MNTASDSQVASFGAMAAAVGCLIALSALVFPLLIKIMNFTHFSPSSKKERKYCTLHSITESLLIVQFSLLLERFLSLKGLTGPL